MFFIVHSTIDSTVHFMPLNSLEQCWSALKRVLTLCSLGVTVHIVEPMILPLPSQHLVSLSMLWYPWYYLCQVNTWCHCPYCGTHDITFAKSTLGVTVHIVEPMILPLPSQHLVSLSMLWYPWYYLCQVNIRNFSKHHYPVINHTVYAQPWWQISEPTEVRTQYL